jgi:hypothetical protein
VSRHNIENIEIVEAFSIQTLVDEECARMYRWGVPSDMEIWPHFDRAFTKFSVQHGSLSALNQAGVQDGARLVWILYKTKMCVPFHQSSDRACGLVV